MTGLAEQIGESGLDVQNKTAKTEIINKSLAKSFVLVVFVFFLFALSTVKVRSTVPSDLPS